jgi:hypothetical protein
VATASSDETGKVWDATTGQEIRTLRGHASAVRGVAFSPDGQRLATASPDRTVKIWDAATGQEALTLRGHTKDVQSIAFSPDGQRLAAAAADSSVRVWETNLLTLELRQQRQAAALVNRLTAELLIKEDVLQSLRQDPTLPEPVRKHALTLLERYREDPQEFANTIWPVINHPGEEPAKYKRALRQAEVLCRMDIPERQLDSLFALGTAQYRVGNYQDAVETLKRADALYSDRVKGENAKQGFVYVLPFLAMVHHQLGQKEQTEAVLTRLREAMKLPVWSQNSTVQSLLREAEALIEGKAPDPKK